MSENNGVHNGVVEDEKTTDGDSYEISEYFKYEGGHLLCESRRATDIYKEVKALLGDQHATPCFVFSKKQLERNIQSYTEPMAKMNRLVKLNYAIKANMNPSVLRIMKDHGCSVTLVSGYELELALMLGFEPEHMVLNGNGKQIWEIELAVKHGCLLNIDSMFNLQQTKRVCRQLKMSARVLLRVNPDIDPSVHHYICTGKRGSKFGIQQDQIDTVAMAIKADSHLRLVGLHCHLGSTISDVDVFRQSASVMLQMLKGFREQGFTDMRLINLGGGLGIDYTKQAMKTSKMAENGDMSPHKSRHIPTPREVVESVEEVLKHEDVDLILEPGRSLVGNAAILLTEVLGVKHDNPVNYIVVNGSMTEVLRPALYGAYHHVDLAEPSQLQADRQTYEVVGPVCESADFLGKDRYLQTPHEGCTVAVFDVGAYCASMGSNYNMRPRPAEVLVDGNKVQLIRRPDTMFDILNPYLTAEKSENTHIASHREHAHH